MHDIADIFKLDPQAQLKVYQKGDILQRAGDIKAPSFYVKKGLLRSYIIDEKGKEHIYMFASENWVIADLEAIEFQEPVQLFIDCLEETEVVIFDKDCLFKEGFSKEKTEENAQLLYRRMGKLQRRVLMLMSSSATERYHYFLKTYPELPNRVPQRMIATYLGITPQALSTIRSKMARKP